MDMKSTNFSVLICLILQTLCGLTRTQTRYACLQRKSMRMLHDQSDDNSESDEDSQETSTMTGSLGCGDRPGTRILLSKVIHGRGGPFASCASPNEYCDDVIYSSSRLSDMCDRKMRCFPTTTAKLIPQCGILSNFIHVEYECVNPWSVFDICHDSNTNVQLSTLYIVSPKTRSGASTCECIIKGHNGGHVTLDYVHSNTDHRQCEANYLLVESKSSSNQTVINKNNICGRKTVTKDVHHGSIRLTYGTKTTFFKDGFLSKITVDDGDSPDVSVQCGAVFSEQDQLLNAQGHGSLYGSMGGNYRNPYGNSPYGRYMTTVPPFQRPFPHGNATQGGSGRNAARWSERGRWDTGSPRSWDTGRNRSPYWDRDYYDSQLYKPRDYPPPHARPHGPLKNNVTQGGGNNQTSPTHPVHPPHPAQRERPPPYYPTTISPFWRGMRGRRNRNLDLFADGPMSRRWGFPQGPPMGQWPQNKRAPSSGIGRPRIGGPPRSGNATKPAQLPGTVQFIGNSVIQENLGPPKDKGANTSPGPPLAHVGNGEDDGKFPAGPGRMAAYIVGGIGAVLCLVGGLVVVVMCRRRKKKKHANSENPDNEPHRNIGPIYSLSTHNLGRVHVNEAYMSSEGSVGEWCDLDLDESEDNYNTRYTPARASREDRVVTGYGSPRVTADISTGTVLGISNLACPTSGGAYGGERIHNI